MSMKRNLIRRFLRNERGNVFIIIALSILVLVAVAGAAVDLARSQIIQLKLQQATDAAALAAGKGIGRSEADRTASAMRLFSLNFPDNYMGSGINAAALDISYIPNAENLQAVNIRLDASVDTDFVQLIGVNEVGIGAETEVAAGGSVDLDVIIVADTTASMNQDPFDNDLPPGHPDSKLTALKDAMNELAFLLLNPANLKQGDRVRVAIYEYGTLAFKGEPWFTDTVPAPELPPSLAAQLALIRGDNPKGPVIFTSEEGGIAERAAAFTGSGWTNGGQAAMDAAEAILNDLPPRSDGTFAATKAWVFLTDGLFNIPVPPGQPLDLVLNSQTGEMVLDKSPISEQMFRDACDELEDRGVQRYTILFGTTGNRPLLRNCASAPKADFFFEPQSNGELRDTFRAIALQLRDLVITK